MALLISVLTLLISLSYAEENVLTMEISSNSGLDFYLNEPVTLKCHYKLDRNLINQLAGFGYFRKSDSLQPLVGCDIIRKPLQPAVAANGAGSNLAADACKVQFADILNTGEGSLTFNFDLKAPETFACSAWTQLDHKDSSSTEITSPKTAPSSNIFATVDDSKDYHVGELVEFSCVSNGGLPEPDWEYRKNDQVISGSELSFVASKNDKTARLSCRDKSHLLYKGGNTQKTKVEVSINVHYLEAIEPKQVRNLTPGHHYKLHCQTESNLPQGDVLNYEWKRGEKELEVSTEQLDVQYGDQDHEVYHCEASTADKRFIATTEFSIHWVKEPETTTQLEQSTDNPKKGEMDSESTGSNTTAIAVGVVVAVVVIVIIVVVIVFVIKRRSGSMQKPKGAEAPTKTPKEVEEAAVKSGDEDAKQLLDSKEPVKAE